MFEEFDQGSGRKSRRQLAASLAASFVVYTSALGSVVAASAAYHKIVEKDDLVQVELRPPPKPEPPKPPPPPPPEAKPAAPNKPVVNARAKVIRPELKTPDEVPDEKPEEADGPLPDAPTGDEGKDGFLDGVVGGTGTASASEATYAPPPPPPAKPSAPVPAADNVPPEYPRAARRAGIAGVVKARIWITETGTVSKVEILEGDPIFHSAVIEALMTWRYQPARQNGTPVAVKRVVHFPFQLQ